MQFYIVLMDAQNNVVEAHVKEVNTANWEYTTLNIRGSVPVTAVNARVYIILRSTSIDGMGNFVVDTTNFEYGSRNNLLVNASFEKLESKVKTSADGWFKSTSTNTG
ncbi:hypothetical protein [Paenibacillus odorifer]|uniref:hypothetical protein n=2 Tax=Paenibacillus TaxID=44249 RepID=UPI00096D2C6D|nr:hypothetical protein [Paenibacillus odorifer]OMD49215.1 hypothetical protein BSK55_28925 [Paenibacillus odorifer]